jgi:hypothetical protein
MPAHLKALVAILFLNLVALAFLRGTITPALFSSEDFNRRRNLWLLVTSIAFLSGNFWIYAILCYFVCVAARRRDPNPLALYVFLLFAIPPYSRVIPGIGPIDNLISLHHERILTLAILVPMAFAIRKQAIARSAELRLADMAILALLGYQFLCSVFQSTTSGYLRQLIYLSLDTGVIYYVASRALRTTDQFREVMCAFVAAMAIMAVVAVFETGKSWWVYQSLSVPFGAEGGYYTTRGSLGLLRAKAALGHPITLGYNIGVALMLTHALWGRMATRGRSWLLVGLLCAGTLMTFSRGPWVGTAAGFLYLLVSGPGRIRRIFLAVTLGALATGVLMMTPFGRSIYGMLPFVGNVDSGSITYRQLLWDASMVVLKQNLWFGDMHYLANPLMEKMRQGEGIIDMVNTYLQFAMPYGIIGLGLFVLCLHRAWRGVRGRGLEGSFSGVEEVSIRRALRAALLTICITIATVSSIGLVPVTYWLFIGLCVGYGDLAALAVRDTPIWNPAGTPAEVPEDVSANRGPENRDEVTGRIPDGPGHQ